MESEYISTIINQEDSDVQIMLLGNIRSKLGSYIEISRVLSNSYDGPFLKKSDIIKHCVYTLQSLQNDSQYSYYAEGYDTIEDVTDNFIGDSLIHYSKNMRYIKGITIKSNPNVDGLILNGVITIFRENRNGSTEYNLQQLIMFNPQIFEKPGCRMIDIKFTTYIPEGIKIGIQNS